MNQRTDQIDPLFSGFFSIAQSANLLGVSPASVRGWINGHPNSNSKPVVSRDFSGTRTVSFLDLMEMRFIAFFRAQGVSMQTLRRAADKARNEWNVEHPLALSSAQYVTDRKRVFATEAKKVGDQKTWDMATGQHEMWITIEQTIEKGVVFDPNTYLAKSWQPKPEQFPDVIIDPKIAFGRPVVHGTKVPTTVLFSQWKAEGSKERVAKWFDVTIDNVTSAIGYELVVA